MIEPVPLVTTRSCQACPSQEGPSFVPTDFMCFAYPPALAYNLPPAPNPSINAHHLLHTLHAAYPPNLVGYASLGSDLVVEGVQCLR